MIRTGQIQQHNLPKISVVVPSYNQGRFLRETLRSIFSQHYPNLEVIVMDGGSTDNSVDIITEYAEKITYWQSEPDGGQSAAINAGMKRSTGELIAWLNSDDYYFPGAFDNVAKCYADNPDASFYFGDGEIVNEKGKRQSTFFPRRKVIFNKKSLRYGVDYIQQPSTFMNGKFLKQVGYLNESLYWVMDYDLWIKLAQLAPPVVIPATISAARAYAANKTQTGSFKRIEEMRLMIQQHTGCETTPGVLMYFLDTLYQYCEKNPLLFDKKYLKSIRQFGSDTADQLIIHGAGKDGFPKKTDKDEPELLKKSKLKSIFSKLIGVSAPM